MKRIALIAACVALQGCGMMEMQRLEAWNAEARPQAESGQMLWSEYYTQAYDRTSRLPDAMTGKGLAMLQAATLIDAARAMEAGQMPQEEFFSLQRKARAQMQMHHEQAAAQQQAIVQQWMQTQAVIQQQYRPAPTTNCTTYRVGNTLQTNCR